MSKYNNIIADYIMSISGYIPACIILCSYVRVYSDYANDYDIDSAHVCGFWSMA